MESDRIHARAAIMRAAVNYDGRARGRAGLARLARATTAIPGIDGVDTRALVRHIRDGGRDARRRLPRRDARGRGARADRRRAEHGRARPRARGDDRRAAGASRARATGRGSSRSTPASSTRSSATSPRAGRRSSSTRARRRADELLARDPDGDLPRPGPGRPGGARLHRRHDPRADRAQAGVRDLPRPPAALARGRARDVQAPVRPPRRQPPGQGPAHRADRDHVAEPRLRGPRRAGHAAAVGLRRGRAHAREPLRRHGRGAAAARRARRLRPVPPRGGPGAERLARPVRRVPRELAHA